MIQKLLFRSLRDQSLSRITYHTFVRSFVRHFPSTNSVEERNFRISSPTIVYSVRESVTIARTAGGTYKSLSQLTQFCVLSKWAIFVFTNVHIRLAIHPHTSYSVTLGNFHSRCIALFRVSYIRFYLVYGTLLNSSAPKTRQEPLVHIH